MSLEISKEERQKLAAEAMKSINKDYGEHSVISLAEKPIFDSKNVISTGSLGLDIALGVGGLPQGRIVEIYGPESSGKTTICTHIIAEAQKKGGLCAIIDAEHAFDREYAESIGVNCEELIINQPDYGDQALEIADRLISSGAFDVIFIDSVAALVPKAELDGEMGESKMGLQARLMSQALRKLTAKVSKTNTLVLLSNQLRLKIGVMFGSPETTAGGESLKFYASVRLDVRRSLTAENTVSVGDEKLGNKTTVKVIKNKVAPPFKKCEFNIMYGVGIDKITEIIELAHDYEVLKKWGKTITYGNEKYEINSFMQMLKDNLEFYEEIRNRVLEQVKKK